MTPDELLGALERELGTFEAKFSQFTLDMDEKMGLETLMRVRSVLSALKYADEEIVSTLGPKLKKPVSINGSLCEAKWSRPSPKWDHQKLRSVVSEKIIEQALDPETGAFVEPVSTLVGKILDYCGVGYWRVGELEKIGLSANDYREAGASKVRIEILGSKK